MVTRFETYDEVYRSFRWHIPESYNIAWDVCDRHAQNPSRLALIHQVEGKICNYTFLEIQALANRLANTLISYGLKRGDRVLLQLPQHPVTAFAHVACWKAGLVSVPASILFGADGLEYRLQDSGARVLITDNANVSKAVEVKGNCEHLQYIFVIDGPVVADTLPLMDVLEQASPDFQTLPLTPNTPAFINYTSGTTGLPKGTLQGHRSMLGHMPGAEIVYDFFPQDGDLFWSPADWAWLAGLMDVLMPAWFHGLPVLTFPMAKFDPELALHMMGKHGVRNALLTPTVLKLLRPAANLVRKENVRLRSIASGGESVGGDLLNEMTALFGVTLNEGYGQTECNLTLGNCASLNHFKSGALGAALPGHVVAILDTDGQPVSNGVIGNIGVRRPDPVMLLEYWNKPDATREKFVGDWLLTGDLGSRDDEGFFWFFGRADDVITSSGYRIGPGEIENAILRHPAVSMSAAIGVPDPQRTERIRAYIVLKAGYEGSEELTEEIKASVKDRLAKHEYPREIIFVSSLPMTTTGKILRRDLRERARVERLAS